MKRMILGGLLVVALVGVGLRMNVITIPVVHERHAVYRADFRDDRVLMGAAHNVFVGTVTGKVGDVGTEVGPGTQFSVDVLYNIKGHLDGLATISQEAGYRNGILHLFEGDSLLEPGKTYLLASRYDETRDWHIITSHPNGRKWIQHDGKLGPQELQQLIDKDEKVTALLAAYKDEILLDADVKQGNTRNSYRSLEETR